MGTNKVILLLIVLSVLISGCLSSEDEQENEEEDRGAGSSSGGSQRPRQMTTPVGMQEEMWTSEETATEGEMWTPGEAGIDGETWSPGEMGIPEETVTQEEFETPIEAETQGESGTPEETAIPGTWEEAEPGQTEAWTEEERTGAAQPGRTAQTSHSVRIKDYLMIPSRLEINTGETVVWKNYQESSVLVLTSREYLFEDQRLVYGDTTQHTFDEPGSYNFSVKGYPRMQMTITVK
ncbi:cell surface lipoprotein [Methanosarcina sp. MSH10X1]|uniref:cupredoxin domain-containing protein n=1 Tax=Methanosarcina sp. MSH10X1 TaxID=2507075 RepID=UPI000FFC5972|nr:cupredoxin domain-containing protein [Methanosarcina sp. MSH10X1]RXA19904.1 cell surface lipoprotein [Methanosarcina sp. MSH10X1]